MQKPDKLLANHGISLVTQYAPQPVHWSPPAADKAGGEYNPKHRKPKGRPQNYSNKPALSARSA